MPSVAGQLPSTRFLRFRLGKYRVYAGKCSRKAMYCGCLRHVLSVSCSALNRETVSNQSGKVLASQFPLSNLLASTFQKLRLYSQPKSWDALGC